MPISSEEAFSFSQWPGYLQRFEEGVYTEPDGTMLRAACARTGAARCSSAAFTTRGRSAAAWSSATAAAGTTGPGRRSRSRWGSRGRSPPTSSSGAPPPRRSTGSTAPSTSTSSPGCSHWAASRSAPPPIWRPPRGPGAPSSIPTSSTSNTSTTPTASPPATRCCATLPARSPSPGRRGLLRPPGQRQLYLPHPVRVARPARKAHLPHRPGVQRRRPGEAAGQQRHGRVGGLPPLAHAGGPRGGDRQRQHRAQKHQGLPQGGLRDLRGGDEAPPLRRGADGQPDGVRAGKPGVRRLSPAQGGPAGRADGRRGGAGALAAAGREHHPARRVHPLLRTQRASSPASTSTCSTGCSSG